MHTNRVALARAAVALAGLTGVTAALTSRDVVSIDVEVYSWLKENLPPCATTVGRGLSHIGQGGPLTLAVLAIAIWVSRSQRSFRPLALWVFAFLALLVVVGPIKVLLRRGAPADEAADAAFLFSKPFCMDPACQSYPSGHAANAVVWYYLATVLLSSLLQVRLQWVLRVLAPVVATIATVVAGFHWLTDAIAGVLTGLFIICLMQAFVVGVDDDGVVPGPRSDVIGRKGRGLR